MFWNEPLCRWEIISQIFEQSSTLTLKKWPVKPIEWKVRVKMFWNEPLCHWDIISQIFEQSSTLTLKKWPVKSIEWTVRVKMLWNEPLCRSEIISQIFEQSSTLANKIDRNITLYPTTRMFRVQKTCPKLFKQAYCCTR